MQLWSSSVQGVVVLGPCAVTVGAARAWFTCGAYDVDGRGDELLNCAGAAVCDVARLGHPHPGVIRPRSRNQTTIVTSLRGVA